MFVYTIKFNKKYSKLHNQNTGKLLHVDTKYIPEEKRGRVLGESISDFLKYDTHVSGDEYVKLTEGNYLLLTFLGEKDIPFTTCRKYTRTKEVFYRRHIGYKFQVELTEGE